MFQCCIQIPLVTPKELLASRMQNSYKKSLTVPMNSIYFDNNCLLQIHVENPMNF